MDDLSTTLDALLEAYARAGLDGGAGLLGPANQLEIARAAKRTGQRFPPELVELYGRFGGQEQASPGTTGLFGRFRLDTPAELASSHAMYCETCIEDEPPPFPPQEGGFHPRLLPFASFDRWTLCIDAATGRVWEYSPNHGTTESRSLPTIRDALRVLLDKVAGGREPLLFK